MAWIQWGETQGEAMLMARTKIQDHEDLLNGNADARIEGVVPRVNHLISTQDAQHAANQLAMKIGYGTIIVFLTILGLMEHFHL